MSEESPDKIISPEMHNYGQPPTGSQTLRIVRQGFWQAARSTLSYVMRCEKDKTVKIRVDDRRSIQAVAATIVLLVLSVAVVAVDKELRPLATVMGATADLLCGLAAFWYTLLRFGVLRALDPRYAVLCFQFAVGLGIIFAYVAVNAVLVLGFRFSY